MIGLKEGAVVCWTAEGSFQRRDKYNCKIARESIDLSRTSENLVTPADTGSDLVILRLRVTEAVEFRLGSRGARRSIRSRPWDEEVNVPGRP